MFSVHCKYVCIHLIYDTPNTSAFDIFKVNDFLDFTADNCSISELDFKYEEQ